MENRKFPFTSGILWIVWFLVLASLMGSDIIKNILILLISPLPSFRTSNMILVTDILRCARVTNHFLMSAKISKHLFINSINYCILQQFTRLWQLKSNGNVIWQSRQRFLVTSKVFWVQVLNHQPLKKSMPGSTSNLSTHCFPDNAASVPACWAQLAKADFSLVLSWRRFSKHSLNQPRIKEPHCKPQAAPLETASCSMHSPCCQGLCSQLMDHAVTYTSWARSNKSPLLHYTSAYIAVFNTEFCTTSYTRVTIWVRFSAGSCCKYHDVFKQNMLSSVLPVSNLYGLLLSYDLYFSGDASISLLLKVRSANNH